MRDRTFVAIWGLVGALTGAILAAPVGQISVDNPPACTTCPQGAVVLLVGLHVSWPYPLSKWVLAVALSTAVFAALAALYASAFRD